MKTIKQIKKAIPSLDSEKVEILADELDRITTLKRIFNSKDGKVLLDVLRGNCAKALRKLVAASKNEPKFEDLIAYATEYSANVELIAEFRDISSEKEIDDQLEEAVREVASSI